MSNFILEQQDKILDKLSIVQHHDAITGTSNKNVMDDYYVKVMEANSEIDKMNLKLL